MPAGRTEFAEARWARGRAPRLRRTACAGTAPKAPSVPIYGVLVGYVPYSTSFSKRSTTDRSTFTRACGLSLASTRTQGAFRVLVRSIMSQAAAS